MGVGGIGAHFSNFSMRLQVLQGRSGEDRKVKRNIGPTPPHHIDSRIVSQGEGRTARLFFFIIDFY